MLQLPHLNVLTPSKIRHRGTLVCTNNVGLNSPSLHHRRQVAATTALYKMHTSLSPPDLTVRLPKPDVVRPAIRISLALTSHTLTELVSRTYSTGRTFLHSAVQTCNGLPDSVVGEICDNGAHCFKSCVNRHLFSGT